MEVLTVFLVLHGGWVRMYSYGGGSSVLVLIGRSVSFAWEGKDKQGMKDRVLFIDGSLKEGGEGRVSRRLRGKSLVVLHL